MKYLLVTNDFPPKIGGIQSYLWELWRRLDPDNVAVLTTPHSGAAAWDAEQAYRVVRTKQKWLLPTTRLVNQINRVAEEFGAELVVLDPVFPLGVLGPRLDLPYVAIAHGAEYAIPAKLPVTSRLISKVTNGSSGMIASGQYVASVVKAVAEKNRNLRIMSIPPGVDPSRFVPTTAGDKRDVKKRFGISPDAKLVVGVSRLVPRKGFDRLVVAAGVLQATHPDLAVVIAGSGRDDKRLRALIERHNAPVTLLGRVDDADLPSLYAAADVFCMPCHDRWFGLEREGFGIVFVEAGAAGVCSVAGASGGSSEAVVDGETGLIVGGKVPSGDVARALGRLLDDDKLRSAMGRAARMRAEEVFSYDRLAAQLDDFCQSAR